MADLVRQSILDRLIGADVVEEVIAPEGDAIEPSSDADEASDAGGVGVDGDQVEAQAEKPAKKTKRRARVIERRRPKDWEESLGILKRNLLRDLEWLLNTRRTRQLAEDGGEGERDTASTASYRHLNRSLYNYGLVDIATFDADSHKTPEELRRTIEDTIELFEPRLEDVTVTLVEAAKSTDRRVQFLIEGTLRTEPDPQRVEFDTVFEIASKRFEVSSHG